MKKYYSATKTFRRTKPIHPFYRLTKVLLRLFFPKNDFIWKTERPSDGEPIFFVSNHTKVYAPIYYLLQKKTVRVWSNCYFMFFKDCWSHIKNKVLNGRKGAWILKPIAFILTPLIVCVFRAIEPIPVFHKSHKLEETFAKSIYTMNEGIPQVIFPERTENRVNRYIYQFNQGFPMVAEIYYQQTGKRLKFYPVYCAERLRTFVVGDPIEYDPNIPLKLQRKHICEYLENKICELGDSLPEHEPVVYG